MRDETKKGRKEAEKISRQASVAKQTYDNTFCHELI